MRSRARMMTTTRLFAVTAALAAVATTVLPGQDGRPQTVTPADIDGWKQELSNWGRWGADDQHGALNLITRAKRRQAAALVQEGFSVSLARRADYEANPDTELGIPGTGPYVRNMARPTLDWFELRYHGFAHTHIDSLAHGTDNDVSYNGYVDDDEAVMTGGQPRNAIDVAEHGIFTRGILMDIPRLKGVPYLEPGERIYPADLEAWEEQAGMRVAAGDALFIRTGRWARREALGAWNARELSAGLDASVIPWLRERDIAILAGESPQDAVPPGGELSGLPVHNFALVYLGVHLFDNVALDDVADAAAARNHWEFLLTVAPLRMVGGTGSPINPIATF